MKLGHFYFLSGNWKTDCSFFLSNKRNFLEKGRYYKYIDYFCILMKKIFSPIYLHEVSLFLRRCF